MCRRLVPEQFGFVRRALPIPLQSPPSPSLQFHWLLATILVALSIIHSQLATRNSPLLLLLTTRRSPLASACVLWLRSRLACSGADDSASSGKKLCVDSSLASFGAFAGARHPSCVGSLRSRSPSSQSPDATRRSPLLPHSLATDHWPLFSRHSPLATVAIRQGVSVATSGSTRLDGDGSISRMRPTNWSLCCKARWSSRSLGM